MTHIQNIPHILTFGITHRESPHANPTYVNIGDGGLIYTRAEKKIYVNNGGQITPTTKKIRLSDYIPFYLGKRMPMLYVIQRGYNGVRQQLPENIVYCVCTLQNIIDSGRELYFTDGHAINKLSSCYDSANIVEIDKIVDFAAVNTTDWTIARDLKRKMEAEFLVQGDIPFICISGFICYNITAKQALITMGIQDTSIHIRPNYYF